MARLDTTIPRLTQTAVKFRIVGFPDTVARLETGRVEMPVPEIVSVSPYLVDPPSLLPIGVGTRIENDPVSRLEGSLGIKSHEVGTDHRDDTKEGAAFFSEACMDQFLMIHAVHPPGVEPSGKRHLELVPIIATCLLSRS